MAALCLPCTATVAAWDSRRVYSLPTVYNTCIAYLVQVPIPYRTYTVPYQFVVSSARAWLIRSLVYTVYALSRGASRDRYKLLTHQAFAKAISIHFLSRCFETSCVSREAFLACL